MEHRMVTALDTETPLAATAVGGKVAVLNRLLLAGFPVPPGICLTTTAFRLALAPFRLAIEAALQAVARQSSDWQTAEAAAGQISQLLAGLSLPDEIQEPLLAALGERDLQDVPLAVRSSAVHEDGTAASFAGQYVTSLGVHGQTAVVEAVLHCWRSFYTAQAIFARAQAPILAHVRALALLIQPLIDAECAGVAFSLDPVAQTRERIVVSSAWGLGSGVAGGIVPSDTDWLYRDKLAVQKRHIVAKDRQVKLDDAGREQILPVPQEAVPAACLPEAWLRRVGQFAVASEHLFGRPQEVEWAIAGEKVWVLQSRPITALPPDLAAALPFPVDWAHGDQFHAWIPSHYRGYRSDPPLPLEYDQFLAMESIREEACRFMGLERHITLKRFNGYLYERSQPINWSDADRRLRHQAWQDWQDRLFDEGRSLWEVWGPEVELAAERLHAFDVNKAGGEALARHLEEALAALRRHAFIHPLCTWRPRRRYFAAYTAVSGEAGLQAELLATQLLQGVDNPLTRLIDAVYELAVIARGSRDLHELLRNPGDDALARLSALPNGESHDQFRRQLAKILDEYGERHGHGYGSWTTVYTPTWREQPGELLQLAATYLGPEVGPPAHSRARAQQARDRHVAALLARCRDAQAAAEFKRLLAIGRYWWAVLETHNHFIDQMTRGHLRRAVMAAASRLVDQQILPAVADVFWLTFAEILQALRGAPAPDLRLLLRRRKKQQAAWEKLSPPPFLGLPEPSLVERPPFANDLTAERAEDGARTIRGQAGAPGRAQGMARVLPNSVDLPHFEQGDILVARNIGPRLTPLFPLLGGLVLDSGSVGQHAAVTAREYGIPAVIATGDATKRIADGSCVQVDGTSGVVQLETGPD